MDYAAKPAGAGFFGPARPPFAASDLKSVGFVHSVAIAAGPIPSLVSALTGPVGLGFVILAVYLSTLQAAFADLFVAAVAAAVVPQFFLCRQSRRSRSILLLRNF